MHITTHITTLSSGRADLFKIAQATIENHEPVVMTGKHGNVVLLSEGDYKIILETLHLQSVPELVQDVKKGRKQNKKTLATRKDLPW